MLYKRLLRVIEKQEARLRAAESAPMNPSERGLDRLAMVLEALGQLSNELLVARRPTQELLVKHDQTTVAHKLADVLIATLLLSHALGMNMPKVLRASVKRFSMRKRGK